MQSLAELPFIGGDPSLDFTNTAEERGHPQCGDVLRSADDLRAWGRRYGVLDAEARSDDPARELTRALQARELLYRLWHARAAGEGDGDPDERVDLRRLGAFDADARAAGDLRPAGDGRLVWRWDPGDLATVRHVAVSAAVDLLTRPSAVSRLKQCPGEHCGWFFLDTTRRGNRRWCLMSECGQAAKTAGRRARSRSGG